ncbi:cyanophycinase [Chitinophaga sp. MD30]|nr:cyanophycinase [Chitinophaga sp. MD30]
MLNGITLGLLASMAAVFFSPVAREVKEERRPASLGLLGDPADVKTPVKGGVALIGGGDQVDAIFKWLIARSGGGDVVVIRATNYDVYNAYIDSLGGINSVETLNINSRELADNDTVANTIRNAEMLFIAGGDQSNYMRYWRGTKTAAAINYLLKVKKAPVGGTSAGCAILGSLYYSGEDGSAVSDEALANPFYPLVKVYNNDFLQAPYLQGVITDQHYLARKREGRHVAFMSRIVHDWGLYPKGIAVDERTAVCIDDQGIGTVIGLSKAYFIASSRGAGPEKCTPGQPLTWDRQQGALQVYEIAGSEQGNGRFPVKGFDMRRAQGGQSYHWWVIDGVLHQQPLNR